MRGGNWVNVQQTRQRVHANQFYFPESVLTEFDSFDYITIRGKALHVCMYHCIIASFQPLLVPVPATQVGLQMN